MRCAPHHPTYFFCARALAPVAGTVLSGVPIWVTVVSVWLAAVLDEALVIYYSGHVKLCWLWLQVARFINSRTDPLLV